MTAQAQLERLVCKCGRIVSADWVELWNYCPYCQAMPFRGWPLAEPELDDDDEDDDHG